MKAIKCQSCKSYVPNDSSYCLNCGKPLSSSVSAAAPSTQPTPGIQITSLLLLGVIVWGAYSWIFSGDDVPAVPKTPAELRQERLESGFSAWDGSHRALTKLVKASMNNPDSYEHVETRYRDEGDTLFLQTRFRGTNAFGGVVTQTVTARADLDGAILEILSEN